MKILMIMTSHGQLGNTGKKTGFWLEEFAAPYYQFIDAGVEVVLASPAGGQPPVDPKSVSEDLQTDATRRFEKDIDARTMLSNTRKLSLIVPDAFDAVFFPGGHGPLWDLADNPETARLIEYFYQQKKPIGVVCHAAAVLCQAMDGDHPLVSGKRLTGFSNSEEAAVDLTSVVPFSIEDRLIELGASYFKADDWTPYVEVAAGIISGQNPASSDVTASVLMDAVRGEVV
ncbi:type 1 glutamine amidotransferase domain-containing protein [Pelagibaculum spongiae]|uniref:Type 1 glutamine amidotransferase domain-containing protein n=1 Tax=Pelagibaculum spongiae TaxID=2080658 RepID=A0A2V1GWA8_9GAMM|nr:type 1 glutamine amidotransferase domain-containing protein [Pelagibaculum spongiae]PVZ70695.1 type 1 glutamine amidotransferase domain-containing protein [Pelagibaculum spongiae]